MNGSTPITTELIPIFAHSVMDYDSPDQLPPRLNSIVNGLVYYENQFVTNAVILFDTHIRGILTTEDYTQYKQSHVILEEINACKNFISPGFIDVHIHGYKGVDTMEGTIDSLSRLASGIIENGITAFLPTTMTMPIDSIKKALKTITILKDNHDTYNPDGAMILGAHLEGPFINEAYKGAQPKEFIRVPDQQLVESFKDTIKVITIAPEAPGALDLIKTYKDSIRFSIGHSGASFEQAMEAFEVGACCTTHLFNAMTGLHHRTPGIVGAAFASDCYSEVIADKIHIHPGLFPVILKAKGTDKTILITDCMQAGGLTEGTYELGGQKVFVKNGKCTLESGTIAGSVLKLNQGLHNFKQATHQNLASLLPLVTSNQATYLGLDSLMGSLDLGKLANIVIMDETISINKTIVKGKIIYENQL